VNGADETPALGQQLAHCSGFHGGEELTAVNRAKVRHVTIGVQTISNDGETRDLHKVQTGLRDQVTGFQKVLDFLADIRLFVKCFLPECVVVVIDLGRIPEK
jgi:hypothetical protein